ncbi:MAG: indolepyruvate ferredoxin oxidoreductase, beta subunit, partial [Thermodesulfobacteriota bacterium]|nr:indolepyruvate ferredoxin oxidoreductase, beta subunit [Thermodesulfobacteriota bacterium]
MKEPFNVVIAGVGGQGNVLASLLVGAVLVDNGYKVTIGETYGASQRGGSVMSHVRISQGRQYGPLIPPGMADLV